MPLKGTDVRFVVSVENVIDIIKIPCFHIAMENALVFGSANTALPFGLLVIFKLDTARILIRIQLIDSDPHDSTMPSSSPTRISSSFCVAHSGSLLSSAIPRNSSR